MSLIKCPECGKDISDTARICPNCGYNLKSKKTKFISITNKINKKFLFPIVIIAVFVFWIAAKKLTFDYSFSKYGDIGEYSKEVAKAHTAGNSNEDLSYTIRDLDERICYQKRSVSFLGKEGILSIYTDQEYVIEQIIYVYAAQDSSLEWDFTDGEVYDNLYSDAEEYYNTLLKKYTSKLGDDYDYLYYDTVVDGVFWVKDNKKISLMLCEFFRDSGLHIKPQVQITISEDSGWY